ncbi:MAG: hypothetical protein RBR30_14045 [Tenuifilaceae bacterium]|nr:hypothetical protein [Tenuifilaceae bacterium]
MEEIFNAIPNTPQGDELENLTALIERYEAQHYCIDLPDPVEACRKNMYTQ